jgi:hypothetical protein
LSFVLLAVSACLGAGAEPELDILYPPGEKFLTSSSSIPVAGRVKWCDGCAVFISGAQAEIKSDGSFTADFPLTSKQNIIVVKLIDGSGARAVKTLNVVTSAPVAETAGDFKIAVPAMAAMRTKSGIIEPEPTAQAEETAIPDKQTQTLDSKPSETIPNTARLSDFEFNINGKSEGKQKGYIIRQRAFASIASPAFAAIGAVKGPGGKSLIIQLPAPLKSPFIPLDDDSLVGAFTLNGETYLPVRAALEKAGWSVHWQSGRIYLTAPCAPSFIEVSSSSFRDRRKVETLIHKNTMFASARSIAGATGATVETISENTVKLTGHGKSLTIVSDRKTGRETTLTLMSDMSPPLTLKAPGPELTDIESIVPVKAALAFFGYETEWDGALKRALAEKRVVVGMNP